MKKLKLVALILSLLFFGIGIEYARKNSGLVIVILVLFFLLPVYLVLSLFDFIHEKKSSFVRVAGTIISSFSALLIGGYSLLVLAYAKTECRTFSSGFLGDAEDIYPCSPVIKIALCLLGLLPIIVYLVTSWYHYKTSKTLSPENTDQGYPSS